jgi:predicted enzyme related to lactoylglutathione lyase
MRSKRGRAASNRSARPSAVVTFYRARSVIEMEGVRILKDISLIIYPVADLDKAKAFFRELMGSDPYVDSRPYTGYKSADGNMEIGLIPSDDTSDGRGIAYWTVSDINASIKALENAGGTVTQPVKDVGYGLLVAAVKDPNGAIVGLRQPPKG